ncbi:MAG: hypothetical protein E7773_11600 [Sphingomonas sp.]|uniref:hypothetical protein n=1 Tax=Sphingomonas sp. TaxID=28214 RepID=UPI00121D90B3|nr:hypothetical protein [Sphingomonas sp.]THD35098.1 MAG: hypothetical protein E7773_11600 [Sphingomonas sp.]
MRLQKPPKSVQATQVRSFGRIDALRIVRPIGPGPIRQIITGNKVVVTTNYPSKKNRCAHPAEAQTEGAGTKHDEVVTHIVRSKPQPFRIEAVIDGVLFRSVPDRIRLMADGSRSIVEFKREWKDFEREEAQAQSTLAIAVADELGLIYERKTLACLGDETRRANINRVQLYRFVPVTVRQEMTATRMLAERGPLALGELADAMAADHRNGFAHVCALMVRRIAAIDLDGREISRDSRVDPVPPLPTVMPSINV